MMHDKSENKNFLYQHMDYALKNDIIDLAYVQEQILNMRKNEILKLHKQSIWYSEKEECWYCHLPAPEKKEGRKKVKRKKREAIEKVVVDFYMAQEKEKQRQQDRKNRTFEEVFYEYMEYKKGLISTGTIQRVMCDWRKFYQDKKDFIQKPIREISKIDVDRFLQTIVGKDGLNKKCFYNAVGIAKQTFLYAVDSGDLEENPFRVKVNKKKIISNGKKTGKTEVYQSGERELIMAEMERRFQNNRKNTAPLGVMLDFYIGTRRGEMAGIRLSDIDFENRELHICRQVVADYDTSNLNHVKSNGFHVVPYTKSADGDRIIPLPKQAVRLIRRIMEINRENGYSYKDYLFVREDGIMSPDAFDAQLYRGCEYIGIPPKSMHKIRKTYASYLFDKKVNISVIAGALGHADEKTTVDHYIYSIHNSNEAKNMILNALD